MTSKTCFVIMPISKTNSVLKKNWTYIYEEIIRPAVEGAGLDFKCKRSIAERGNILKDIINDLYESDIVIADLTDRNPNVFYELGVRHGFKPGTIILTQHRKFASIFDLTNYASHVYSWKSPNGKKAMIDKIRQLLQGFLSNPTKSDNPVSDFLENKAVFIGAPKEHLKKIIEYDNSGEPHIIIDRKHLSGKNVIGFLLLAKADTGLTLGQLTKLVSKNWKRVTTRRVSRILNDMKSWIITEGERRNYNYRLSGTGRKEIREIIIVLTKNN